MSDFPILIFTTPQDAAFVAVAIILALSCYLIYLGIHGMIKQQSIAWSVTYLLGGLSICAMFVGTLIYFYKHR